GAARGEQSRDGINREILRKWRFHFQRLGPFARRIRRARATVGTLREQFRRLQRRNRHAAISTPSAGSAQRRTPNHYPFAQSARDQRRSATPHPARSRSGRSALDRRLKAHLLDDERPARIVIRGPAAGSSLFCNVGGTASARQGSGEPITPEKEIKI